MRLSEAIRLGAMIRPKADGFFFYDGASCAQGAALEATGTAYSDDVELSRAHREAVLARWPEADDSVSCPACGTGGSLAGIIAHLNNTKWGQHDWTREQIADWVETIEPPESVVLEDVRGVEVAAAMSPGSSGVGGGDRG